MVKIQDLISLLKKIKKSFIEVKNVTLLRKKGIAEFPDAETLRGSKHLRELIKASNKGFNIYIVYVVQREDCDYFSIAKDIDKEYAKLLTEAVKKNLKLSALIVNLHQKE